MSIITGGEAGGSLSSGNCTNNSEEDHHRNHVEKQEPIIQENCHNQNFHGSINSLSSTTTLSNGSTTQLPTEAKKKRNPPGNPDPNADVIALSPTTLMAKNRFVCEICSKGFQRDQNLQLHRRGHNLPWKLRQRNANEIIKKRVYICPEASCVHHNPARALGDLTGIKKHFSRKHGEKKWKCERCNKKYAVQSDWKAHSKTCGTREYKCECGTIFSRRDSFITHRAFCDAIAEENSKTTMLGQIPSAERHPNLPTQISNRSELISSLINSNIQAQPPITPTNDNIIINDNNCYATSSTTDHRHQTPQELIIDGSNNNNNNNNNIPNHSMINSLKTTPLTLDPQYQFQNGSSSHFMSATALLQKAAQMGSTGGGGGGGANGSVMAPPSYGLAHHHDLYGHGPGSMMKDNNVGFFGGLLLGHHQNHAGDIKNDVVLHGTGNSTTTGGDVMTVDFLGIGRSQKQVVNNLIHQNNNHKQLEDHHYHQVLRFNNGHDHQSDNLQGLSQFDQHSGIIMGKHVWEV